MQLLGHWGLMGQCGGCEIKVDFQIPHTAANRGGVSGSQNFAGEVGAVFFIKVAEQEQDDLSPARVGDVAFYF